MLLFGQSERENPYVHTPLHPHTVYNYSGLDMYTSTLLGSPDFVQTTGSALRLPATPFRGCQPAIKCLSCSKKKKKLHIKSIRSTTFFKKAKCTYFKILHSNKFLRGLKKKYLNLRRSFCTNVKGASIRKNSQENLGTEDLGRKKKS